MLVARNEEYSPNILSSGGIDYLSISLNTLPVPLLAIHLATFKFVLLRHKTINHSAFERCFLRFFGHRISPS